jgi:hypothetical protein
VEGALPLGAQGRGEQGKEGGAGFSGRISEVVGAAKEVVRCVHFGIGWQKNRKSKHLRGYRNKWPSEAPSIELPCSSPRFYYILGGDLLEVGAGFCDPVAEGFEQRRVQ